MSCGIEKVTLLTGCVPCQGLSVINRKYNDNDERNFLFLEYMKYVQQFCPDFIILKNVSGHRYTAEETFKKSIIASIQSLVYVGKVKLLNESDYVVPQYRYRLIFVVLKT